VDERHQPVYPAGESVGSNLVAVVVETSFFAEAVQQPGCCELAITEPEGEPMMRQTVTLAGLR
jgi:hypothetical protein